MERKDLLEANAQIFPFRARRSTIMLQIHCGSSLWVTSEYQQLDRAANAPDIDPRRFTAMTRLDHNRALSQLAAKTGLRRVISRARDLGQPLSDPISGSLSCHRQGPARECVG